MTEVNPLPGLGTLTVSTQGQQQRIVNGRKRQGKIAGKGRPDLDFKSLQNPNAKKAKNPQGRLPTIVMQGPPADDMGRRDKRNPVY